MKWILLWAMLSPTGSLSSGAVEFDTKPACEVGGAAMADALKKTGWDTNRASGVVQIRCVGKSESAPPTP
jgi:hypothetical protein